MSAQQPPSDHWTQHQPTVPRAGDTPAGGAHPGRAARPPWSQRTPELVAGIGATLLTLAALGGVIHSWDLLTDLQRGVLLIGVAVGLTTAGVWADTRTTDARARHTITLSWAGATALVVAAVDLTAGTLGLIERVVVALAGLAGAAHAGTLLATRRRGAVLQHVALFATLVYAIGPVGIDFAWGHANLAMGWTLEGLFVTTLGPFFVVMTGDLLPAAAVVPNAVALAVIGAAWAGAGTRGEGAARYVSVTLAAIALAWGALLANSADDPVGAAIALAIVLGLLIAGIARDDALLVTLGAIGTTVAGLRVLAAILTGAELVIVIVGGLGLAMIVGALWMLRRRAVR